VWRSRSQRLLWCCQGDELTVVAPTTMATVAVVAWHGNRIQKRKNQIGKSWHLTMYFFVNLASNACRAVLTTC
jgi:hypothetical protein